MAARGAAAGAVGAVAAPGAAGAVDAAAPSAALGWPWMGSGAAPASLSHAPWAGCASLAPPLQQQQDPTVTRAPRSKKKARETSLAQAKKSQILVFKLLLSGVPAVPVNSKNHLCLHLPRPT